MTTTEVTVERNQKKLLSQLLEILEAEYSAVKKRDTERLTIVTADKTRLIDALTKLTAIKCSDTLPEPILYLLKQCKDQNIANGLMLQVGLRNAQRLHNILQGADGLPTAYDGDGEPTFSPHSSTPLAKI